MNEKKTIGKQIKEAREKIGISRTELAIRLGTNQQNVSRWELEKTKPSVDNLQKLSLALDIQLDIEMPNNIHTVKARPLVDLPLFNLSETDFQRFCKDLLVYKGYSNAIVYGVSGDSQDGIDVSSEDNDQIIIQCKRVSYGNSFGKAKIQEIVNVYNKNGRNDKIKIIAVTKSIYRAEQDAAKEKGWQIWGLNRLTTEVRTLDPIKKRELVTTYFPNNLEVVKECLGLDPSTPFVSSEKIFAAESDTSKLFSHGWDYVAAKNGSFDGALAALTDESIKVIIISGAGGIGKTRLLKELSEKYTEQAYVLLENFEPTVADIQMLSDKSLLVIDDAHRNMTSVKKCISALSHARLDSGIKILIATRSYGLNGVKVALSNNNIDSSTIKTVELKPMDKDSAMSLTQEILGDNSHCERLAELTKDSPLFLVIGASLIRDGKITPDALLSSDIFQEQLRCKFDEYLNMTLGGIGDVNLANSLIQLISVIQPFTKNNTFEELAKKITDEKSSSKINKTIADLEKIGLLSKRRDELRIAPDLLGDYYCERATLNDDGTSNGYVDEVIENSGNLYLKNILQNVCQLDWRMRSKSISTQLLNKIWSDLENRFLNSDASERIKIIQLLAPIAYYQSQRTLNLVRAAIKNVAEEAIDYFGGRINQTNVLKEISPLLGSIAHIAEFTNEALSILVELADTGMQIGIGQDDKHPLRVMQDLASLDMRKPIWYIDSIVDFVLQNCFGVSNHKFSPFDILDKALETDGTHTSWNDEISLSITQFNVSAKNMSSTRRKIIEKILACLSSDNQTVASRATESLRCALSSGEPIMNWHKERKNTLERLEKLVSSSGLTPFTLAKLHSQIAWHATRDGDPEIAKITQRIINGIPKTLEYKISLAIVDCWGHDVFIEHIDDIKTEQDAFGKWRNELADDAMSFYGDNLNDLVAIIKKLTDFSISEKEYNGFVQSHFLVDILCRKSKEFCNILVSELIGNDELESVSSLFGLALAALLSEHDDKKAVNRYIDNAFTVNKVKLLRSIASFLAFKPMLLEEEEIISLSRRLLELSNSDINWVLAESLSRMPIERKRVALELIDAIPLNDDNNKVIHLILGLFDQRFGILRLKDLNSSKLDCIMKALVFTKEIDYNAEPFLNELAQITPERVVDLLLKRIDYCISIESRDASQHYSPIPYEARSSSLMIDSDVALHMLLEWMQNASDAWQVSYFGEKLLEYIKLPSLFIYKAITDLLYVGYNANERIIRVLVQALPKEFLWTNYENIQNILRIASKNSSDCFDRIKSSLFGIVLSGTKSGSVGQPFPSDIELRDKAKETLEKLSPTSAAYGLYSSLYNYALQEIGRVDDRF
jgi:transcriptional regulator with XRE-family HTH domain